MTLFQQYSNLIKEKKNTNVLIVDKRRKQSATRPNDHSNKHENFPVITITKVAENRSNYHVTDNKNGLQ